MDSDLAATDLKRILDQSATIVDQYRWLIDAYVLDFYVENQFDRLPSSWRHSFGGIGNPELLAVLLSLDGETTSSGVLPLSLLALRACLKPLVASRATPRDEDWAIPGGDNTMLGYLFRQVKEKKRHEILRMAKMCANSAERCGVNFVIDFGAGLGHLSRILSYCYGMRVCCLEQQVQLSDKAR